MWIEKLMLKQTDLSSNVKTSRAKSSMINPLIKEPLTPKGTPNKQLQSNNWKLHNATSYWQNGWYNTGCDP